MAFGSWNLIWLKAYPKCGTESWARAVVGALLGRQKLSILEGFGNQAKKECLLNSSVLDLASVRSR